VYDDANSSKLDMLSDLKNQAVIYMWFNKITGKVYIGSAIDGKKRLSRYYMPSVLKTNSRIYKNILKYGHNSFIVSILEVLGETKSVSKSDILAREQFYLDWALKTYGLQVLNLLTITNSSLGLKHTLETKAKIAEARSGKLHSTETKDKLSQMHSGENNPFFDKKHTSEFITKLKQRTGEANPMFGKEKSLEFIAHMVKDRSGVNNPMYGKAKSEKTLAKLRKMVWVYDVEKNYKLLGIFPTVMCTKTFHIGYEALTKRLQDGKIHKGKYFSRNPLDKENF
jgi:group I intron endonuclease